MGLDAGTVLKRSVLCTHCNEAYLFTLRAIADNPELRCYGCAVAFDSAIASTNHWSAM
jgi:hypothetical protein